MEMLAESAIQLCSQYSSVVSLCAAVAGFVCARSHLEAAFCAKILQWSAACEAMAAIKTTPVPS